MTLCTGVEGVQLAAVRMWIPVVKLQSWVQ